MLIIQHPLKYADNKHDAMFSNINMGSIKNHLTIKTLQYLSEKVQFYNFEHRIIFAGNIKSAGKIFS